MYEYALDDVDRKFNNQVCLLQTDKLEKNFYFITRQDGGGYTAYNAAGAPVGDKIKFNTMKFTYFRFLTGFYPTKTIYGYALVIRSPENKVFTQGLGRNSYRIGGDVSEAYDLFKELRGTFEKPEWYNDLSKNGALSRLYRKTGRSIFNVFSETVAKYSPEEKKIYLPEQPEQELIDLLNRNDNYGATRVNQG